MHTHDILHRNEGGDNVRLDVYLSAATVAKTATASVGAAAVSAMARFVTITSANAAHIVILPTGVVGWHIEGFIGANGCELRTPASSGEKINSVDSDGTNQAALP